MIHFCRECDALNYHDAAPVWAVPCTKCGAVTKHQPHDPKPTPALRGAAVAGPQSIVLEAGTSIEPVGRVVEASAVGELVVAPAAPPAPVARARKRAPRAAKPK